MNRYIGALLTLVLLFPWLFSWFAPFFYIGFVWVLAAKTRKIVDRENTRIAIGFLAFIITGFLLIFINAYIFGNIKPWTYWIAGYATWFIIILLIRTLKNPARTVHSAMVATGFVAGVSSLVYIVLYFSGFAEEPISVAGYQAYFGLDSRGFFAYSTSHLPHLAFLVPYFAYRFAKSESNIPKHERLILIVMVIAGILSLRTAIYVVYFASAAYYIYLTRDYKSIAMGGALFIGGIVGLMIYFEIGWDIWQGIYDLKLADKLGGEDLRYNQLIFWLNSFLDSPLIGHGLTSAELILYDIATGELIEYTPGPIVSEYGYEILYAKLLSDIGVLLVPYIAIFCWLSFLEITSRQHQWQVRGLRLAALSMIFQSATNSYLQTSGWLFTLMLPMVFIASRPKGPGPSLSETRCA